MTDHHHHSERKAQTHAPVSSSIYPIIVGLAAIIWIIVRVVPKPDRAGYPCMRVAMSLATGIFLNLFAIAISALSFLRARASVRQAKIWGAICFTTLGLMLPTMIPGDAKSSEPVFAASLHVSNAPMGEAKGIFPGRVVWEYNPRATNPACNPASFGHGWFLPENSNQAVVDSMLSSGVRLLTGEATDRAAWTAVFKFHNAKGSKGAVGYTAGEKIFIKINATSGWDGNFNPTDLSKLNNYYYGISETSPPIVLSVLRALVDTVGVAQTDISVGDPMKHVYKHCYDLWHGEFPNVHYLDHDGYAGREQVARSTTAFIKYSDRGTILRAGTYTDPYHGDSVKVDTLYAVYEQADYLINIPMLKGHKRAGMTMFAKNHFGSQQRADAQHLHMGLVSPAEEPTAVRAGYGLYRIQVDLMGHKLLEGKELLFLMDALWATDYELDNPVKWQMPPFNNNWMSSLFVSLDPVAIESVGYDFLRSEFTAARGLLTCVQMDGVDDYLHQAADSVNWPAGIIYDPEGDGTPLPRSLGVHEHWNDSLHKQYSRNLGTGNGIELVQAGVITGVATPANSLPGTFALLQNYPNPFNPVTTIVYQVAGSREYGVGSRQKTDALGHVKLAVYDLLGREVAVLVDGYQTPGEHRVTFDARMLASGVYFYRLEAGGSVQTRKMTLLR